MSRLHRTLVFAVRALAVAAAIVAGVALARTYDTQGNICRSSQEGRRVFRQLIVRGTAPVPPAIGELLGLDHHGMHVINKRSLQYRADSLRTLHGKPCD